MTNITCISIHTFIHGLPRICYSLRNGNFNYLGCWENCNGWILITPLNSPLMAGYGRVKNKIKSKTVKTLLIRNFCKKNNSKKFYTNDFLIWKLIFFTNYFGPHTKNWPFNSNCVKICLKYESDMEIKPDKNSIYVVTHWT